jgi:hypothetical protein
VTQAWAATHAVVVQALIASTSEATVARERVAVFIMEVEAWATLAERGARESAASLASDHAEADEVVHNACPIEWPMLTGDGKTPRGSVRP